MDYLVLQSVQVATDARRKMNANFMRYHADWQEGKGFGRELKNISGGANADPAGKSDAELLDGDTFVMMGIRNGQLNTVDGFTTQWCGPAIQRLNDGKYCLPLPESGSLRDALLVAVPQPNSIETDPQDGTWFPIEQEI